VGTGLTPLGALESLLKLEAERDERYKRYQLIEGLIYRMLPQLDMQTRETLAAKINSL